MIVTNVIGTGEVSLTATVSCVEKDPTQADDTLVLKANTTSFVTPPVATPPIIVRPVLGKAVVRPTKAAAGKRFTFSLPVTRSDTGKRMLTGKMACEPTLAGKAIAHSDSFKAGTAQLSLVVPKTAKGKWLKVAIKITAAGQTAARTYNYAVR